MLKLIREAVARGWCTDRNSHKEMDSDLAEDIATSIYEALFGTKGLASKTELTVGDLLEAASAVAMRREASTSVSDR